MNINLYSQGLIFSVYVGKNNKKNVSILYAHAWWGNRKAQHCNAVSRKLRNSCSLVLVLVYGYYLYYFVNIVAVVVAIIIILWFVLLLVVEK